ncbi:glycosyltransferase family 2 protein [Bizionia argentinensis JUB59]|uniref:Glycosyltransferase family 2 protein n=1 Tax=Bizionia argentinensis JUB59 TaxID=1046627 RepID=G2EFQ4_9FLAO|nr:glycosyltransferase family 2 protein [Bizionia argentinensis]EGV42749.1 glycosyltransferase family 2 protein [Bizionia argentinensis JUB59]
MKIAVVILNWNGKPLLEQFLPSVVAFSEEATIYVADNASTDDSITFIKQNFPSIKTIRNSENGGYAKGYNDALRHVEEDIYCLLNSDVEVTENWLKPILSEFDLHPDTAIIQPKILDYKNKDYFEYAGAAGGFIDKYGYPFCRGRVFDSIEKDEQQYQEKADIFWASGACFFIRKSVFETLNGFDESFFAHMEEIDMCWRAFNLDYKCVYLGTSTVYHVGGATLQNTNPKKTYLNFRNSLFTLTKNAPENLFSLVLTRLILDGIACIKFLVGFKFSHILSVLKAHFSYYKNIAHLLQKRRKLTQKSNYFQTKSIIWDYFILGKKSL